MLRPLQEAAAEEGAAQGLSPCYVLLDGHLAALLLLGDSPRREAAAAVQQLQRQGLVCAMLTGDCAAAAQAVAAQVGLPAASTHSTLLPQDKLQLLQQYRRHCGAVAHVGDGINDAPALANADVGIAMGLAGSALAIEAADVALFSNDLGSLPFAVALGRRVAWVTVFNITFAILIKAIVLGLAFFGHITLWLSVLADVGSALAVTLHSLTVLRFEPRRLPAGQDWSHQQVHRQQAEAAVCSRAGCVEPGPLAACSCCDGAAVCKAALSSS
jgi:Cd2+/Zn2+-exporting ATPase